MEKLLKNIFRNTIVAFLFFSSCVPLKDYVYIQGELDGTKVEFAEPEAYRIQSNDNLYIQVISNDELAQYFNLSSTDRYLNNDAAIELGSYKVDIKGEIEFPYIGTIKVSGLTTSEIKDIISHSISERLVQYSVIVKHVNRSVSLLGEFKNPGTYSIYKDRITIFEAIGMGKDLTDFANRHNVKIIRQVNGEKMVNSLDLTKVEIFSNEFYFVLPNDVIYAEPTNRVYGARTLPVGTIIATVNAAFSIYYFINNLVPKKP